jgi:hypothetical protein
MRLFPASAVLLWVVRTALGAGVCPTTPPPSSPFEPPIPYQSISINGFWYGTEALWVQLPIDGRWGHLPFNDGSYAQKIFWFRRYFDWRNELQPDIVVRSKRLDVDGPTFTLERATHAILSGKTAAILTGAVLPTVGCWQISGQYRGKTLTFVVSVEP